MYNKSYEIFLTLTALQTGTVDQKESEYIKAFFKEHLHDEFDEKEYFEIMRELQEPTGFDLESSGLRIQRYIDYLDYKELKLLFKFLDVFLKRYPLKSYRASLLLIYSLRLLHKNSGLYITKRNYPFLFSMLKDLEACDLMINRLNIIRSQLADMVRTALGSSNRVPLWEIIVILTTMHCYHSYVEDEDLSIYNIVIRFARASLVGLSFQQVMRICRNIQELSVANPGTHMLFLEQIDEHLDFKDKKDLVSNLLLLKNAIDEPSKDLRHFHESILISARFNSDELGRLIFNLTQDYRSLPEYFDVHSVAYDPVELHLCEGEVSKEETPRSKLKVIASMQGEDKVKLEVHNNGQVQELEFAEGEEQYFDTLCFLFKPKSKEFCVYKISYPSLYVKNAELAYKGNKILDDVSMMAKTGEMVALVGPSGCGKSTMLTMLSGILEYTGGDIYFNGKRVSTVDDFAEISTYIPQDDILFRELTVHESIENSVRLKVKTSEEDYEKRLKSTIEVLGLQRTEFLKIGNEGEKGISGGQRKRVNIGTTIVADMKPILLFDEPTSGLDPATDLEIMQLLRELSRRGHIVMVVTHNLSDESMGYFDKLLVLGKTGQVQFFGKNKRSLYFFSINSTQILFQKMKDATNIDYHEKFYDCTEHTNVVKEIEYNTSHFEKSIGDGKGSTQEKQELPGMASNFKNFISREMIRKFRDPQFLMMCVIQPILIGLFISWNFVGPLPNALFSLITATLWIGAISGVREINSEMPQLKRDYMYGTSLVGYFVSKIIGCLTFSAFQVFVLLHIVMFFGNYLSEPFSFAYFPFLISLVLLNLFGICLGLFLSASIKSTLAAVGVLPVILIPIIIMGGALIRHNHTEGPQWAAMKYNPLRIAYESTIFSAENILEPHYAKAKKRSKDMADEQLEKWVEYKEKLKLFHEKPDEYADKYGEGSVNDIFSDLLSEDPKEVEVSPPTQPPSVEAPLLLEHQMDMWRNGYSLLPVNHPKDIGFFDYARKPFYDLYPIDGPKAFSEKISAQGAIGMFKKDGDKNHMSVYSPGSYTLITLLETFLLCIGMYFILRFKLSSKF